MKRLLATLPAALLVFVATASAAAEDGQKTSQTKTTSTAIATNDPRDQPAATDAARDEEKHLSGLELVLRPSFGNAGSSSPVRYGGGLQGADPGTIVGGSSSPYSGGFVGHALIGYRFHPLVSAGLRAGFRTASTDAVNDGSTAVSRSAWDAGFYARAYPLAKTGGVRKIVDPWVGVGVGYMRDQQSYKRTYQNLPIDFTLDHHAIAVPLGVGIDYRVLPLLSIGPSFEYTVTSAIAGCLKVASSVPGVVGSSYCSNEDPGKQFMKAENYGVWTAGLDVRATF